MLNCIKAVEDLTSRAIVYSVLIECEAAPGGKSWEVVLSDDHARKGKGKAVTLDGALVLALRSLNDACGGQLRRWVYWTDE